MIDMVDEMMKGGTGDKVGLSLVTVEKYLWIIMSWVWVVVKISSCDYGQ